MMTAPPASPPINTFKDILDVLEQEPQLLQAMRGYILDQEIRDIPSTVAELVSSVNLLATDQAELKATVAQLVEVTRSNTERIDRLEATVAQLVEVTRSNTERIDRLEAAVERLETAVAQLVEVTRSNTERIDRLEAVVGRLEAIVAQLVDVSRTNTEHLQRVSGLVADIAGTRYERFVTRIVHRRLRRLLPIPDATVIHTDWNPGEVIGKITGSDDLSDDEVNEVSVIDFIAAGRDAAGNQAYAAGEISITAQPIDVIKAAKRAASVAKALDATVHPVVIGQMIPDDTRAAALGTGVTIIDIAPPPN